MPVASALEKAFAAQTLFEYHKKMQLLPAYTSAKDIANNLAADSPLVCGQ